MSELLCIVNPTEHGFFEAALYVDGYEEGLVPDFWCTGKKGGTREEIQSKVQREYKGQVIKFVEGVTGVCVECGENHSELETVCVECGGEVQSDT